MKDFKCLPKMKTGGSVKKYSEGNIVEGNKSAIKSAIKNPVDLKPGLTAKSGSDRSFIDSNKGYKVEGIDMPTQESKRKNIPRIDGGSNPAREKLKEHLVPLKNGGKAKRGNKK